MAMAEMKYIDDVPAVVSIDEAVGLARKYSTEKSVGYVNGVLGSYTVSYTHLVLKRKVQK